MSKCSSASDYTTNPAAAKKSRPDIDDAMAESKAKGTELLDALKAQKAVVQWGHTTCRDDTVVSIKKAELLIDSTKEFGKMSQETIEKLIDALVESEMNALTIMSQKYTVFDECRDLVKTCVLEAVRKRSWSITEAVKKQLKEKLAGLSVDDIIKNVREETQIAYKAIAMKEIAGVLESVLT